MTYALCFHCGGTKFGALVPCMQCDGHSTGDVDLDIAFSDHHIPKPSLEKLGEVIAAIKAQSNDEQLCFWTFIHYVSVNHSSILNVKLPQDAQVKTEALLDQIALPEFTIEPNESETDHSDDA